METRADLGGSRVGKHLGYAHPRPLKIPDLGGSRVGKHLGYAHPQPLKIPLYYGKKKKKKKKYAIIMPFFSHDYAFYHHTLAPWTLIIKLKFKIF
jgi:hypothetical protein